MRFIYTFSLVIVDIRMLFFTWLSIYLPVATFLVRYTLFFILLGLEILPLTRLSFILCKPVATFFSAVYIDQFLIARGFLLIFVQCCQLPLFFSAAILF